MGAALAPERDQMDAAGAAADVEPTPMAIAEETLTVSGVADGAHMDIDVADKLPKEGARQRRSTAVAPERQR